MLCCVVLFFGAFTCWVSCLFDLFLRLVFVQLNCVTHPKHTVYITYSHACIFALLPQTSCFRFKLVIPRAIIDETKFKVRNYKHYEDDSNYAIAALAICNDISQHFVSSSLFVTLVNLIAGLVKVRGNSSQLQKLRSLVAPTF